MVTKCTATTTKTRGVTKKGAACRLPACRLARQMGFQLCSNHFRQVVEQALGEAAGARRQAESSDGSGSNGSSNGAATSDNGPRPSPEDENGDGDGDGKPIQATAATIDDNGDKGRNVNKQPIRQATAHDVEDRFWTTVTKRGLSTVAEETLRAFDRDRDYLPPFASLVLYAASITPPKPQSLEQVISRSRLRRALRRAMDAARCAEHEARCNGNVELVLPLKPRPTAHVTATPPPTVAMTMAAAAS